MSSSSYQYQQQSETDVGAPAAPAFSSLMAEARATARVVGGSGDAPHVLRSSSSDVRLGVYRAISSRPDGVIDSGNPGETLAALRERFAREEDANCLSALLDAARSIPGWRGRI